ncbi:MAG: dihydropteroate synthase [Anaerolineae bacterium]|nr:dihydropteroate synthase [Anaerolineae bacterium]NUQ04210.1 dihydropteroate synthase [Anaerolineae bacterium]
MQTQLRGIHSTVLISPDSPTVMIGERLNPTGRKAFSAELQVGDLSRIARDAASQVAAGATVLDVNVGAVGVDEVVVLPRAVQIVQETVDVPVSIDSASPTALVAVLKVVKGRPLINSLNAEEKKLRELMPIVAEYGAVAIALCMPDGGIPPTVEGRLAAAEKILEAAERCGVGADSLLFDPLATTISTDHRSGLLTLETTRELRRQLGVNITVGASNASHGMPERETLNLVFMTQLIAAGVNAPICNPNKIALAVKAADLMLGRDEDGMSYIRAYRALEKLKAQTSSPAS